MSRRLELAHGVFAPRDVDVTEHHRCTRGGKHLRGGEADAGRGASDDRRFSMEFHEEFMKGIKRYFTVGVFALPHSVCDNVTPR